MRILRLIIPASIVFMNCLMMSVLSSAAKSESKKIDEELVKHGFSNSVVIESIPGTDMLTGLAASGLIANTPDYREGATAVLSRNSVAKLKELNGISGIYAVSTSSWKLQTAKRSANVNIYGVSPKFLESYHIIRAAESISDNNPRAYYIGTKLASEVSLSNTRSAELSLKDKVIASMPPEMRNRADWNAIKQSISIEPTALDLPQGIPLFENGLFTTGPVSNVTVGSMHIVPSIKLFVLTRDRSVIEKIIALSPNLIAAQAGYQVITRRFSDRFASDISPQALRGWEHYYLVTSIILLASTIFISCAAQLSQTKNEVALRFAFGARRYRAVLYATRHVNISLLIASLLGLACGTYWGLIKYGNFDNYFAIIVFLILILGIFANMLLVSCADIRQLYKVEVLG